MINMRRTVMHTQHHTYMLYSAVSVQQTGTHDPHTIILHWFKKRFNPTRRYHLHVIIKNNYMLGFY